jgi:hypothetical protein
MRSINCWNGSSEPRVVTAIQEDAMLMFYLPLIILEASLAMSPWSAPTRKAAEVKVIS